jgi:hypothetical protein
MQVTAGDGGFVTLCLGGESEFSGGARNGRAGGCPWRWRNLAMTMIILADDDGVRNSRPDGF